MDTYKFNKKMYLCLDMVRHDKYNLNTIIGHDHNNQLIGGYDSKNDFYITHSVASGEKTLFEILKDGYLRPGKEIHHANILSSGGLENIYANINFCDLKNIEYIGNVSLQFSSQLIFDFGIIFNRGWFMYPRDTSIWIHESDTLAVKYNKLNEIKEYLKNPTFYPKFLIEYSGYIAHEIMIDRPIPLDKYLISINCVCSKKYKNKISKIIRLKYQGVKILDCVLDEYGYSISPSLKDIIEK